MQPQKDLLFAGAPCLIRWVLNVVHHHHAVQWCYHCYRPLSRNVSWKLKLPHRLLLVRLLRELTRSGQGLREVELLNSFKTLCCWLMNLIQDPSLWTKTMFLTPLLTDNKSSATAYAKYVFNCFHTMFGHCKIVRPWGTLRGPKLWLERSSDMEEIQWRKYPKTTEDQNDSNRFHIHTSSKSIRDFHEITAGWVKRLPNSPPPSDYGPETKQKTKHHGHIQTSHGCLSTSTSPQNAWWHPSTPNPTNDLSFPSRHLAPPAVHPGANITTRRPGRWLLSKLLFKAKFWDHHYPFEGGGTPPPQGN